MKLVKLFFILTLVTLPLGQLSRLEIVPNVAIFLSDVLLPLLIIIWLTAKLALQKKLLVAPFSGRILLFIFFAWFTLLLGSRELTRQESLVSGLFLLRLVEYLFLYFIGHDLFKDDRRFSTLTVKLLGLVAFLVAVLGFFQVILIPDFSELAAQGGWDPHQYRLLSTFFDPNFVGGFLVFCLSFIFVHFLSAQRLKDRLAELIFLVSGLSAVVLTFSRSSYLALITAIVTFGVLKSKKIILGFVVFALIVILSLPPVQNRLYNTINLDDSARARFESWENALTITADHLLFGVGFNTYRFTQERYGFFSDRDDQGGHAGSGADSSLLLVAATTGLIGLAIYLFILWGLGREAFAKRRQPASLAFLVGMAALLVHSQFVNALFYPQIMEVFWIGAALMVAEKKND